MSKNPTWQKTISWLVISYLLIAFTAWYESGSLSVGLLAAFWACVIKTPVYSIHESLWGKYIFPKEVKTQVITICKEQVQEAVEAA